MMEVNTFETVHEEPGTSASAKSSLPSVQAPDADQLPGTADNVTFQLPSGSSSSAQVNHVSNPQPEIESPDCSDRTIGIEDLSAGIENETMGLKRRNIPPDRFGSGDFEGPKKYKKGTSSSRGKKKGQPRQTVNKEMWLSTLDGVFEEIKVYEKFFRQIDTESGDLNDVLKRIWDTEFYERQIKAKFPKVITEGRILLPEFRDSQDSQAKRKFEDLQKKYKAITNMADKRVRKLWSRHRFHKLMVEITEIEDFMEESSNDITRRQKDEKANTMEENQQGHQLLEKKIRWRQGRIEDIKERITPDVLELLEIGDLISRLKNVEGKWATLVRNVEDEGKFYQFEKACDDNCTWFTNATEDVNNENFGDDTQETEALLKALEIDIANGSEKCSGLEDFAKMLIEEGNPNSERIRQKESGVNSVKSLSNAFQEVAKERQKALQKLLIFSKQSDEIVKLITENKKLVSDSMVNCAVDLTSLASHINGHGEDEENLEKSVKLKMGQFHIAVDMITKQFPVVREHVTGKKRDCVKLWRELQDLHSQHRQIKIFFENHAKVMNKIACWISEVNGIQVGKNLSTAKAALEKSQDYEKEIREYGGVEEVMFEGNRLLEPNILEALNKVLMDKMASLTGKWDLLIRTVEEMLDILKENVDTWVGVKLKFEKLQERKRLLELIGRSVENA